jgi:hypothetical protein
MFVNPFKTEELVFNMFMLDSLSQDIGIDDGSEAGEGVLEPCGRSSLGVDGAVVAAWSMKPVAFILARAGRRP